MKTTRTCHAMREACLPHFYFHPRANSSSPVTTDSSTPLCCDRDVSDELGDAVLEKMDVIADRRSLAIHRLRSFPLTDSIVQWSLILSCPSEVDVVAPAFLPSVSPFTLLECFPWLCGESLLGAESTWCAFLLALPREEDVIHFPSPDRHPDTHNHPPFPASPHQGVSTSRCICLPVERRMPSCGDAVPLHT